MESKPSRSKPVLIWLIVSQLLALGSLVLWLLVAGLSVMAFDSGVTREAWTFVIAVWSYPVFPLLMAIVAWIAYARRLYRLAVVLTTLTFLPPVLLYLFIFIANSLYFI